MIYYILVSVSLLKRLFTNYDDLSIIFKNVLYLLPLLSLSSFPEIFILLNTCSQFKLFFAMFIICFHSKIVKSLQMLEIYSSPRILDEKYSNRLIASSSLLLVNMALCNNILDIILYYLLLVSSHAHWNNPINGIVQKIDIAIVICSCLKFAYMNSLLLLWPGIGFYIMAKTSSNPEESSYQHALMHIYGFIINLKLHKT